MAQKVREVMTADPATVDGSAPATEAAALMRDRDTGAIVVTEGDRVTDATETRRWPTSAPLRPAGRHAPLP